MKKIRIVSFIAALLLAVGVQTVFRACAPMEDGSWMNCHYAQTDVFYIALALAVLAIVGIFVKGRGVSAVLYAASAVLAVVAILIPGTIVHMCMMDTMRCHMLLRPFTTIMGILIIVFALVNVILSLKKQNGKSQ